LTHDLVHGFISFLMTASTGGDRVVEYEVIEWFCSYPFVCLSAVHRLQPWKQRGRGKPKLVIVFSRVGGTGVNFQLRRSKVKVTGYQKPQESAMSRVSSLA